MRKDILCRKDEIIYWINENYPKSYICKQLNCRPLTLDSYLKKMNLNYNGNRGLLGFIGLKNNKKSAKSITITMV